MERKFVAESGEIKKTFRTADDGKYKKKKKKKEKKDGKTGA